MRETSTSQLCRITFKPKSGQAFCRLFNPGMPVTIDAMAVHHITKKLVKDKQVTMGCFMDKETSERRKFKRFTYKTEFRPTLDCHTIQYKVLNISEGGLKLEVQGIPERLSDSTSGINGYLFLSNGKQIPVSGNLVWIIGSEIGIKLNKPISEKIIASESGNFQVTE